MSDKIYILVACLLLVGGCIYKQEPMPKILYTPAPAPKIVQPKVIKPATPPKQGVDNITKNFPADWFPPARMEKGWSAIIVHHSATDNGNAAIFDRWHKQGNNWEGVGYDFVIGNGTDSGDGEVEVTFRWRQQITGAHCKTPNNWANEDGVGICLVGNFNNSLPTARQMQSLVKLMGFLRSRYGIPESRIYGHNSTPGARETDCPGRRFSMARLKSPLVP